MTAQVSLRDASWSDRQRIMDETLREPVLRILGAHGPLKRSFIIYFMEIEHDILLSDDSMRTLLSYLRREREVEELQLDQANDFVMAYCLAGESERTPTIPGFNNYERAYLDLYLRYQAIRHNPSLATAPESLIDDLFNPKAAS